MISKVAIIMSFATAIGHLNQRAAPKDQRTIPSRRQVLFTFGNYSFVSKEFKIRITMRVKEGTVTTASWKPLSLLGLLMVSLSRLYWMFAVKYLYSFSFVGFLRTFFISLLRSFFSFLLIFLSFLFFVCKKVEILIDFSCNCG